MISRLKRVVLEEQHKYNPLRYLFHLGIITVGHFCGLLSSPRTAR